MSEITEVLSSEQITSGGGTATSSAITVLRSSCARMEVVGDANSSDFDIEAQVKMDDTANATWSRWDLKSSEDITGNDNNAKVYDVNVEDIHQLRVKITNNAGSNTTMTVRIKEC